MYVTRIPNRDSPPAVLLRESYREGGKVKSRTLANISDWPEAKIDSLRRVLAGETLAPLGAERRRVLAGETLALLEPSASRSPARWRPRRAQSGWRVGDERLEQKNDQEMGQGVGSGGALVEAWRTLQADQALQALEAEFDAPSQAIECENIGG